MTKIFGLFSGYFSKVVKNVRILMKNFQKFQVECRLLEKSFKNFIACSLWIFPENFRNFKGDFSKICQKYFFGNDVRTLL